MRERLKTYEECKAEQNLKEIYKSLGREWPKGDEQREEPAILEPEVPKHGPSDKDLAWAEERFASPVGIEYYKLAGNAEGLSELRANGSPVEKAELNYLESRERHEIERADRAERAADREDLVLKLDDWLLDS